MNEKRRKRLSNALSLLEQCENIVDQVRDEELDAISNYPENLQGTDKFDSMEQAVDNMDDAIDKISEVRESIQAAIC